MEESEDEGRVGSPAELDSAPRPVFTELITGVVANVSRSPLPPLSSCGEEGYMVSSGFVRSLAYY